MIQQSMQGVGEAAHLQNKVTKRHLGVLRHWACYATQSQRRVAAATSAGSGSSLAVKWRRNGAS